MYRLKNRELSYKNSRNKQEGCPFCNPQKEVVVEEKRYFLLIKNSYPYDLWDRRRVSKHLLLIPKGHQVNFDGLVPEMLEEYMEVLKRYSNNGFDIFTRATFSLIKSQPHLHTHLIKTKGELVRTVNFNDDPYELSFK